MAIKTMIHCSRSDHFMTCKNRFKLIYSPECELSFDEGCCAYKGHLHFHLYNPQKPNKFDIKLFQVNEALSGYILGFEFTQESNQYQWQTKQCL